MDSDYDKKFEEMKKYIPFLESMIKRLESTGASSANPRQAQLDKIRSLRDLLLNKKKRMKMENLLKCEQVLINLYAKVEQRDTLSSVKKAPDPGFSIDPPTPQEKSDLEAVRNKLKTVAKKQEVAQETLPEILRVNEVEEIHTAGSKEPALFQRRPNKYSLSPTRPTSTKTKETVLSPQASAMKRNYTRVLVSPETSSRRWSSSETLDDKPLFSRRSPRRSPRRYSPSYHKRERKKSFKESSSRKSKDLNITLNVPEDSLSTLNTKDIFTRIINCKDGDVDIDTLRELRKQILTELKKTGAKDDISDLILKSYSSNKKKRNKRKEEVEEGELSDSESEIIQNVYGNLSGNLVLKDENESKESSDKDKSRKIQICLVINSDKDNPNTMVNTEPLSSDLSELEMYNKESKGDNKTKSSTEIKELEKPEPEVKQQAPSGVDKIGDTDKISKEPNLKKDTQELSNSINERTNDTNLPNLVPQQKDVTPQKEYFQNKANFYKPLTESSDPVDDQSDEYSKDKKFAQNETTKESESKTNSKTDTIVPEVSKTNRDDIEMELKKMETTTEIPLLNEPTIPETPDKSTVSEIDILQALKNEILSETIAIPGAEASTPLMHQPKVIKVASAKEILPKKRISIENYKQKAVNPNRIYLADNNSKDDNIKKPSLKLTEKECERFNIPKISFDDDSSENDDGGEIQITDVYSDLAPKSPDRDESNDMDSMPPVIIPADPVKAAPVTHKADVDMRTLPILSPNTNKNPALFSSVNNTTATNEITADNTKSNINPDISKPKSRPAFLDPRVRRDMNSTQSPSPHTNPGTPRSGYSNVNQSPASDVGMTPNTRSYEMTPNHQSFDFDQTKQHVYLPMFTSVDSRDRESSVAKDSREKDKLPRQRKSRFEDIGDSSWSSSDVPQNTRHSDSFTAEKCNKVQRNDRYSIDNRDPFINKRSERQKTPVPFGRSDVPITSSKTYGSVDKPITPVHPYGRADCPATPSHPFGRSECPPTPSHPFGRVECPLTPSHPFGRLECPPTPSHPFGRSECPPTPSHPFGRSECPPTPSHPFGRSECPPTPSNPFGRNECPPTPSHAFGRSDCPPTTNHPFGSHTYENPSFGGPECHPFSRSDCPTTSKHPFGMHDRPQTPNHPFGRSEPTPNLFGRTDYNALKYNKDPRLNRKSEYESNKYDERDGGYYKDRGYSRESSYKPQRPFIESDNYHSHDREQPRNSRYKYYSPDHSGRHTNKDQLRHEPSIGRSVSKDYENEGLYTRERSRYSIDRRYEDVGYTRRNQRERSVGRSAHTEERREKSVGRQTRSADHYNRSSARAHSVGRNTSIEPENKLSIKSHAGRLFTIDTSVNATFQKFLESGKGIQVFDYSFDARKQRAASVGRVLARESSIGRSLHDNSKQKRYNENKREGFRRAASMGRDLVDSAKEKRSFQEVKADFRSYKHPAQDVSTFDTGKIKNIDTKSKTTPVNTDRSRKDLFERRKEEKCVQNPVYSPKKNYRDPRMRKEMKKHSDKYAEDSRARKSGIVYSNDNIVKGAILASGYGVKNYKIPKIKRAVEEKRAESPKMDQPDITKSDKDRNEESDKDRKKNPEKNKDKMETVKEKISEQKKDLNKDTSKQIKDIPKDKAQETRKDKNKETPKGRIKENDSQSDSDSDKRPTKIDDSKKEDEQMERRLTRASKKMVEVSTSPDLAKRTRKPKRSIISDSDSDTENVTAEKLPEDIKTNVGVKMSTPTPPKNSPVKEKKVCKIPKAVDIDTSFGLEELEMFSDNVASDPVLDNINALIADLDNDLDTSKNESSNDFTKEITLENMMQNITSPQEDNSNQSGEEFSRVLKDVDDLTKESDNSNSTIEFKKSQDTKNVSDSKDEKPQVSQTLDKRFDNLFSTIKFSGVPIQNNSIEQEKDETLSSDKRCTNENIVSTTEIVKNTITVEEKSKLDELSLDGCSTPDSTINTDEVLEKRKSDESIVDSTNEEAHSETNVTSTESIGPKPSSSRKETEPNSELGNLLTMLQDKNKLKQLLSMLGDQSGENEKIKKKLEKLSEIVSDDEIEDTKEQTDHNKSLTPVPTDGKSDEIDQKANEKIELTEPLPAKVSYGTQLNKQDEETLLSKENKETLLNNDEEEESHKDQDEEPERDESFEDIDESAEIEDADKVTKPKQKKKGPAKRSKFAKKGKSKAKTVRTTVEKRVTRATVAAVETKAKPKKQPRELQKLHEDIKEMFIKDDILNATGIRMCRLAKMVDDKSPLKDEIVLPEVEPVVVLEKFKSSMDKGRDLAVPEKIRKKPGPKPKTKLPISTFISIDKQEKPLKYKPGPKSKTKNKKEVDPYAFETDSLGDTNTDKASDDDFDNSSDSEISSLASSKSFGSSEVLADVKKKTKRKRRGGWQDGVIKPKHKKKKVETKHDPTPEPSDSNLPTEKKISLPDMTCFTDRSYCFRKNVFIYECRLCRYSGSDIVHHYKSEHPQFEIPLSRVAPDLAKEAIDQCKGIQFEAFCKISSEKYVCIFCTQEFNYNNSVLETFFWHVVSMHTGEYKNVDRECVNENKLDIPPPPKETCGQLIGYICKKCNFTQLSLENLKNHVIVRHNDEQTAVYTINLSAVTRKALKELLRRCEAAQPSIEPLGRRSQGVKIEKENEETSSDSATSTLVSETRESQRKVVTKSDETVTIKSKITFEADDNVSELSDLTSEGPAEPTIKIERVDADVIDEVMLKQKSNDTSETDKPKEHQPASPGPPEHQHSTPNLELEEPANQPSNDIVDYPHFKININEAGLTEYICCINGKDNHFKTPLLISMKKHVQFKHSEKWDGYCFVCKVIVTPQGTHLFKDCLLHYTDKHTDNFPLFKEVAPDHAPEEVPHKPATPVENPVPSKPYIAVRPIYELISTPAEEPPAESASFPIIQSVVSLGAVDRLEGSAASPTYPAVRQEKKSNDVSYKYEEVQAKVMSNKHRVVLETMMARDKLVKVFKCAGRFCSFTTDSAEEALLHASTHQRIGGVDALNCSYCDFDAVGNAIDLVMHVFSAHGHCQYSCGQCFYRAAACQSVAVHASRLHGVAIDDAIVLRTTSVTTNTAEEGNIMSREEAVPFYICPHDEAPGVACKFRTYTPDKFVEHFEQKHETITIHYCYICNKQERIPEKLVQHMKSHGLRLYQCAWCIHGTDNEAELLTHVSIVHPTKQPQAYLRIITNKDGTAERRVLPLAFLNKMPVPTEDVTPCPIKENPVREAERSIDLEKLISLTMMVEPQASSEPAPVDAAPQPSPPTDPIEPTIPVANIQLIDRPISPVSMAVSSIVASTHTEAPQNAPLALVSADSVLPQSEVKLEPLDIVTPVISEVVVLDSDEEDAQPKQNVIDLSEDETSISRQSLMNKKVPPELLATCPKCRQICKSMHGLKKHFSYCYPKREDGSKCAHCPYEANSRDNILQHYMDDHCDKNIYQCGVCRANLLSLGLVKKHLKYIHKEKDIVVTSTMENGLFCYVVNVAKKEKRELPKRKLSSETVVKKRFWPNQINLLPINPILDHLVYCEICEFSTKVRLNMVRHLQLHAEQQPVAQTAPVNPVPHLETNEKHFDKMVNLASSSLVTRAPDRPPPERGTFVAVQMPPDLTDRYPKHISTRQRNTCGAVGCTYTSVDETMLKRHWEALHSGSASFSFRCVHCPNNQITDTSKPITGARVVAHLKMHDDTLYACSKCNFYHFKREYLEKHLTEVHPTGQLMIVRENNSSSTTTATAPVTPTAAPTMDLKPWQCGLCKFKSMLRPEVVDHCFKAHQSKMQFRCGYCPYRASAVDNVNNHLAHSHANEPEDVIHYYYREGSLPDDVDGTPRWMKQRQKMGVNLPEVKTEAAASPEPTPPATPVKINLNLVKKEVEDDTSAETAVQSIEDLCKRFGAFCEPNGIKYKCPLCNVIMENTREAMQSHLYEELQYRKWGCGLCTYKAFHKAGLIEHMTIEHRRQYDHIELPIDPNIEIWVAGQLDHQAAIIDKYKTNLAKQKIIVERSKPVQMTTAPPTIEAVEKFSTAQLEEAFGEFGAPTSMMYCCPKCGSLAKDEASMREHLEMELNKIRWGCTNCSAKYQTYHEAQFHCKGHDGPSRPKEAIRDPSMRVAWVNNIIQTQKKILQSVSATPTTSEPPTPEKSYSDNENSLLIVRYEERVPTPDQASVARKRPAPDSDEERLIIDEPQPKKKYTNKSCPHCPYKSKTYNTWKEHVLKHSNLKPYACCYCDYSCTYRQGITNHIERHHPNEPQRMKLIAIPPAKSQIISLKNRLSVEEDVTVSKLICLFCDKSIPETETNTHLHDNIKPDFAKKGDVVVKCCICLVLRLDVRSLQDHHDLAHPGVPMNYALFKLHHDTREIHYCGYCDDTGFKFLRDLKTHHNAVHPTFLFKYTTVPYVPGDADDESKKKEDSLPLPVYKRCAKKSTTKLPGGKAIAKKSTTKLPYSVPSTSEDGYSYYKTRPAPLEEYANVTTLMSFCNRMMPFTLKKLSEIINIEPRVVVRDIGAGHSSDIDT